MEEVIYPKQCNLDYEITRMNTNLQKYKNKYKNKI